MLDTAPPTILRPLLDDDMPTLFEQQLDPAANHMAAFTAKDPSDRAAFDAHWAKVRADQSITIRAIIVDGQLAGSVLSYSWFGDLEVSYWLGREYWGRGIATAALRAFLQEQTERPIFARAVHDNAGSIRVLQKCGFIEVGRDHGFAFARGMEVEEVVMRLD
jgi:RimJ/RimL family protein N-acetyltransferase